MRSITILLIIIFTMLNLAHTVTATSILPSDIRKGVKVATKVLKATKFCTAPLLKKGQYYGQKHLKKDIAPLVHKGSQAIKKKFTRIKDKFIKHGQINTLYVNLLRYENKVHLNL